jgi:hypothetical protein
MKLPTKGLAAALAACLFVSGCQNRAAVRPAWRYLQRAQTRVAILPASNLTDKAGASIIIDKAWEEALLKAGFTVVNADSVVTFSSSQNIPVGDVIKIPPAVLGQKLKADYILEDEITDYGAKYRVIVGGAVVACRSRLIEARTGALVWEFDWVRSEQSNNSNNGVAGVLVGALVDSVMDSMMDMPAKLARQGVSLSSLTQPYPGVAPMAYRQP